MSSYITYQPRVLIQAPLVQHAPDRASAGECLPLGNSERQTGNLFECDEWDGRSSCGRRAVRSELLHRPPLALGIDIAGKHPNRLLELAAELVSLLKAAHRLE